MLAGVLACLLSSLGIVGAHSEQGPSYAETTVGNDQPAGRGSESASHLSDGTPVVYLTFDDGPHPVYTAQVLDLLAAHNAKATFFVVGSMVDRWPDVMPRIASEGHSIQLHSWGHDDLTMFTREQFLEDVRRTQAILAEKVGVRGTCLRPPYGAVNSRVRDWSSQLDLPVELWDVTGADWTPISAPAIANTVLRGVRPGAVVLLHDGGGNRSRTVAALDTILASLTREGYHFEVLCPPSLTAPIRPHPGPPEVCWEFAAWPVARPCQEGLITAAGR